MGEKEYEKYMCSICTNTNCKKNIIKFKKGKTVTIKCNNYKRQKINREKYLIEYLNDMRIRNYKNDN